MDTTSQTQTQPLSIHARALLALCAVMAIAATAVGVMLPALNGASLWMIVIVVGAGLGAHRVLGAGELTR